MKKQLYILAATAMAFQACSSDKGKPVIEGKISGAADTLKVYIAPTGKEYEMCDSSEIASDGTFRLVGNMQTEPTFYRVSLSDGRSFTVVLDSAETVSLSADASKSLLPGNVTFANSQVNTDIQTVEAGSAALLTKIRNGNATTADVTEFKDQLNQIILANPRSMAGYYILFQRIGGYALYTMDDKKDMAMFGAVATSLQMEYPNSQTVKALCNDVLGYRKAQKDKAKSDSLLQTATVLKSPNISLPDKDGNTVELTSLRGKTVLLYFWAAADQTNLKEFLALRSIYSKYHSRGLEIYAVSFDTAKLIWQNAISGTEWVNVCDFNGPQGWAAAVYNVTAIPANYIIAPDGELIGKDLFGKRLDNKLNEILR